MMKFSVFAIAALAAATSTSSRYMVAATAASRNRKIQKKTSSSSGVHVPHSSGYGATEESSGGQPPGTPCQTTSDCAIPSGLTQAVCREGYCQSGTSGSSCGVTSDCVKPTGLEHPVCRQGKCQTGLCFDYCGNDSDCVSGLECVGFTNISKCNTCVGCTVCNNSWVTP